VAFDVNKYIISTTTKLGFYKAKFKKRKKPKKQQRIIRYWRFIYFNRTFYKVWPYKKYFKSKKKKKLYYTTKKEKPLLQLKKFHFPWWQARYKLHTNRVRLASHFKAFQLYYKVKRKSCRRFIRSFKNKGPRLGKLIQQLECRLDIILYRLGWVSNFKTARLWISYKWVLINSKIQTNPSYVLRPNDKISFINTKVGYISHFIGNRHRRVYWRFRTRKVYSVEKPKHFDRIQFRKYRAQKRRQMWCRYFLYFFYCPQGFTTNYNTLTAIYKPNPKFLPTKTRFPSFIGLNYFFWQELFPYFLDQE
jgi:ribosomal protein S4